jgi:hypothetical protein
MGPALMEKLEEFNKYYSLLNAQFAKGKHLPINTPPNYPLMEQPHPNQPSSFREISGKEIIVSH